MKNMKKTLTICILSILAISMVSFAIASSDVNKDSKEKPEKITFIHYKDGKIKPIDHPGKSLEFKMTRGLS